MALFESTWAFYDEKYGAFPAKSVDWNEVKSRYQPQIELAQTKFRVSWALARMVAEIQDGHTYVAEKERCQRAGHYGMAYSNTGACLTEVGGRLFVYRVGPRSGSGFELGDELLSIDGRGVEALLRDLEKQPVCQRSYSTLAMARAALVAGLLYRAPTDGTARIRRGGEERELNLVVASAEADLLACDGRVGPEQEDVMPSGIEWAVLPGEVLYVYLPAFGSYDSTGEFVAGPAVSDLRQLFLEQTTHRKGVILDIRGNLGGRPEVYMSLASYLYGQATTLFTCQTKIGAGHAEHGEEWAMISGPDPSVQYTGPLAVLVNELSFSAGDFTSAFVHQTGRGKTFGAPTGGGFGGADSAAPSFSLYYAFNPLLCRGLDGAFLEGNPPPVDFPTSYDPADLAKGEDTVIEKARQWVTAQ